MVRSSLLLVGPDLMPGNGILVNLGAMIFYQVADIVTFVYEAFLG